MSTYTTLLIFVCMVLAIQLSLEAPPPFHTKPTRNVRPRNNFHKRPSNSEFHSVNKHTVFTDDGWRPLYDVPNAVPRKHQKYSRPSNKFPPNVIFTTEHYQMSSKLFPSTKYISNYSQPLQVYEESSKPTVPKSKKIQQKNQRRKPQQYEVYENVEEDESLYDPSQNRFRYQEIPIGKLVKNSNPFLETPHGKSYHHVYMHEPGPVRHNAGSTIRSNRLTSSSRKPF